MALTELSSTTASRQGVAFAECDTDRIVVWLRSEHDASTVAELSETMARAIALGVAGVRALSSVVFASPG
jgi:hypothetical protein